MTEKRRYSVVFIPRVTQVYDKEKDKQLSSFELDDLLLKFEKENKELKSLCNVLITHIERNSIAFVIDEDIRRLLE